MALTLLSTLRETIRTQKLITPDDTLVVGVSGGPDSLALLHALRALAPEYNLTLHVAHLNHQLRGADSDADEQFVTWLAREWNLPVASARWDVAAYAAENRLSVEQAARDLRYRFLLGVASGVHANAIAVAHNADDQVETVLLHFLRGTGLAGLRGMAFRTVISSNDDFPSSVGSLPRGTRGHPSPEVALIRPLLAVTRAEIETYCAENNLQPRTDESNFDITILRNRLRHDIIPQLETINPNLSEVVRHTALSIADDYAYIQQNVSGIFDRMSHPVDGALVFDRKWFKALPINLQRAVLREAITRLRHLQNISFQHIENARRVAADSNAGAQATLPQGLLLAVGYDTFGIGENLPLPDAPLLLHGETIPLNLGDEILLPESDWGIRVTSINRALSDTPDTLTSEISLPNIWRIELDADKIRGQLTLRPRKRGERFQPAGMGGKHQTLHNFMINQKIPRHLRDLAPILADDEKVLWLAGYRADERAASASRNQIQVEFFKARG